MRRWTEVSAEPNSREAKAFRQATLRAAWRPPVTNRVSYLAAAGRRTLDVGVVAHSSHEESLDGWLHRAIAKSAAYCLGVDILPGEV